MCLLVVRTGVMYKTTVVAREGRILDLELCRFTKCNASGAVGGSGR